VINIALADGLSGTYRSAVAAAELAEAPERITVVNTRTLCGPHRYMVETAVRMAQENATVEEICKMLQEKMDTAKSFLVPADFDYLRRGGRLSPLVSYVGQAAGLMPVMTQTEDGCRLAVASIRRGFNHTLKFIEKALQKHGVGAGWRVYITHAAAPQLAQKAVETLQETFSGCVFEVYPLSPAFITQGGPGCIAVQVIKA
jgi:DegV family protein with EDD domain